MSKINKNLQSLQLPSLQIMFKQNDLPLVWSTYIWKLTSALWDIFVVKYDQQCVCRVGVLVLGQYYQDTKCTKLHYLKSEFTMLHNEFIEKILIKVSGSNYTYNYCYFYWR